MIHIRSGGGAGLTLPVLAAMVLASIVAVASSHSRAGATVPTTYNIDLHTNSAGGSSLRNSCFAVSGTVGQTAPGYSSETSGGITDSVYAGFWSAAPVTGLDEIFFTGFEGC